MQSSAIFVVCAFLLVKADQNKVTYVMNNTQSILDELNDNSNLHKTIRDTFMQIISTDDYVDVLDEPSESECVDVLHDTGLIELVHAEINNKISSIIAQYDTDVISTMIYFIGMEICRKEAEAFEDTKKRFYALSEHKQNEIMDAILERGNEINAWEATLYIQCLQLMQAEINDLYSTFHELYPQLPKLKKLLKSTARDTCTSYFSDKRDL